MPIFQDALDRIASQTIPLGIRLEMPRSGDRMIQAVLGRNPQRSRAINMRGDHSIAAQRPRIIRVVFEDGELARHWIEALKASHTADP